MSEVHAQARTTPRTRTEIKESTATLAELAERYNISKLTARKWKNRESPEDRSHRPHKLNTTLTPAQEAIAVELRCMALLPLDDLVAVVREFINPDVSRAGLDRCLRRHGVGNLRELQAKALADAGETKPALKTFKDYEPGFLHMDIKYLPQMPDESHRRYLFVAIDRATRWVFMHIYADQSEDSRRTARISAWLKMPAEVPRQIKSRIALVRADLSGDFRRHHQPGRNARDAPT